MEYIRQHGDSPPNALSVRGLESRPDWVAGVQLSDIPLDPLVVDPNADVYQDIVDALWKLYLAIAHTGSVYYSAWWEIYDPAQESRFARMASRVLPMWHYPSGWEGVQSLVHLIRGKTMEAHGLRETIRGSAETTPPEVGYGDEWKPPEEAGINGLWILYQVILTPRRMTAAGWEAVGRLIPELRVDQGSAMRALQHLRWVTPETSELTEAGRATRSQAAEIAATVRACWGQAAARRPLERELWEMTCTAHSWRSRLCGSWEHQIREIPRIGHTSPTGMAIHLAQTLREMSKTARLILAGADSPERLPRLRSRPEWGRGRWNPAEAGAYLSNTAPEQEWDGLAGRKGQDEDVDYEGMPGYEFHAHINNAPSPAQFLSFLIMQRRCTLEEWDWLIKWYPGMAGNEGVGLILGMRRLWWAECRKIVPALAELREVYGQDRCTRITDREQDTQPHGERFLVQEVRGLLQMCLQQGETHQAVWDRIIGEIRAQETQSAPADGPAIAAIQRIRGCIQIRHDMRIWACNLTRDQAAAEHIHWRLVGWREEWGGRDREDDRPGNASTDGLNRNAPSLVALRIMSRAEEFHTGDEFARRTLAIGAG